MGHLTARTRWQSFSCMRVRDLIVTMAMVAAALAATSAISGYLESQAIRPVSADWRPPSSPDSSPAAPDSWQPVKLVGR